MVRFILVLLEKDHLSRRIMRLTDHPSKYKHKKNYPDELHKSIVCVIIRRINAGIGQADGSSVQTNYASKFL